MTELKNFKVAAVATQMEMNTGSISMMERNKLGDGF